MLLRITGINSRRNLGAKIQTFFQTPIFLFHPPRQPLP